MYAQYARVFQPISSTLPFKSLAPNEMSSNYSILIDNVKLSVYFSKRPNSTTNVHNMFTF